MKTRAVEHAKVSMANAALEHPLCKMAIEGEWDLEKRAMMARKFLRWADQLILSIQLIEGRAGLNTPQMATSEFKLRTATN